MAVIALAGCKIGEGGFHAVACPWKWRAQGKFWRQQRNTYPADLLPKKAAPARRLRRINLRDASP
jgi:hypothetical protein